MFIPLILQSSLCFSSPNYWYDYKNNRDIGVSNLVEGEPCGEAVVHKGTIQKHEITKSWIELSIKLDEDYDNFRNSNSLNLSIDHDYILKQSHDEYLRLMNFLKSKNKMIFVGNICGATINSSVELNAIYKLSSIVKNAK